jgi:quercetin dioxygenase-like cupin family protein
MEFPAMAIRHARPGQIVHLLTSDGTLPTPQSFALFKSGQLELLRLVLPRGKSFPPHSVAGEVTMQVLEGRVEISAAGVPQILGAGQLMHLEGGVEHALKGIDDASVLVTIVLAGPGDA